MKSSIITTLLILSILNLKMSYCLKSNTGVATIKKEMTQIQEIGRKLRNLWTWIKDQSSSENTVVGRCLGAFKKMRMALSFIIFKLGVIVTTLVFLSILAFKTLGVGVLILIISSMGLVTKFTSLKHHGYEHSPHDSGVHLHVHSKGGYKYHGHEYPPWYDRSDNLLPKNSLEKSAIADLYRRIGVTDTDYFSKYDDLRR